MARLVGPKLAAGTAFGRGSGLEAGLVIGESAPNQIVLRIWSRPRRRRRRPADQQGDRADRSRRWSTPPCCGARPEQAGVACTTASTSPTVWARGRPHADHLRPRGNPTVESAEGPDPGGVAVPVATCLVAQRAARRGDQEVRPRRARSGRRSPRSRSSRAPEQPVHPGAPRRVGAAGHGRRNQPDQGLLRPRQGQPVDALAPDPPGYGGGGGGPLDAGLFGPEGLKVSVPGLAKVTIGTPPRMIGGADNSKPMETSTLAAAAVDVVKVQVLPDSGSLQAADLRIGHMEAATAVPEGGHLVPHPPVQDVEQGRGRPG